MRKPTMLLFLAGSVLCQAAFLTSTSRAQTVLLPGPSRVAQGVGTCSDLIVGIASPNWRVRKGRVFDVSATHPFSSREGVTYKWTVSNGQIISGQGTSKIEVKASGGKTPGFLNARGFVSIKLRAERITSGKTCALEVEDDVMIGISEYNGFAEVRGLLVDEEVLVHPCPPGYAPLEARRISEDMIIGVSITADDPENDVLSYRYVVTGGKVIGNGSNISWDLSNVAAGTYSISIGVDDGYGIRGQTLTKTITVEDHPCHGDIECPTISLTGPDKLDAENTFTANVSGGAFDSVTYEWTVTNGEIIEGQNSPSIKVKLNATSSVTVKIGGLERGMCLSTIRKEFVNGVAKP